MIFAYIILAGMVAIGALFLGGALMGEFGPAIILAALLLGSLWYLADLLNRVLHQLTEIRKLLRREQEPTAARPEGGQ